MVISEHKISPALNKAQILAYLRDNPDFLRTTPQAWSGQNLEQDTSVGNVHDLAVYQTRKLKQRLEHLEAENRDFRKAGRENTITLGKVEAAVIKLLEAQDLRGCFDVITRDFAKIMGVDWCVLTLECAPDAIAHIKTPGLYRLSPGSVARVMETEAVRLTPIATFEALVFGKVAAKVGSTCLVKLSLPEHGIEGILGFGARQQGVFDSSQGTRIVSFLAALVEKVLDKWLPSQELAPLRQHR